MLETVSLGNIDLEVVKKDIKNIHLSVYPPYGKVKIAAPLHMRTDTIRIYAISKLSWIKEQQRKFQAQERVTSREYLEGESHYLWGKRYMLKVVEQDASPTLELKHRIMVLRIRPETGASQRQAIVEKWNRDQIREKVQPMIEGWARTLKVHPKSLFIQRMRTKWGSCNFASKSIRLNSELAKKPLECLEYIVVHELVHLIEPTHNLRFHSLMDKYLPHWKQYRNELNQAPLAYEHWEY